MYDVDFILDSIRLALVMFSDEFFVIPVIILGSIWVDREVFFHASCMMLVNIIINFALKIIFHIPLASLLMQDGFSFPSGHMQASSAFYGWLIYARGRSIIGVLSSILLTAIACGLSYSDYHDYWDILSAGLFAAISIMWYVQLLAHPYYSASMTIFAISTILLVFIKLGYGIIPHFVWLAYYSLWGFILSKHLVASGLISKTKDKILATFISFVICYIIYHLSCMTFVQSLPQYIQKMQWVIAGLSPAVGLRYILSIRVSSRKLFHAR